MTIYIYTVVGKSLFGKPVVETFQDSETVENFLERKYVVHLSWKYEC